MPRRPIPDPTARVVGQRIRQLREEKGLTAERLAFESDLGSKGFLSDIEQGRASPSLHTLQVIADYLGVLLLDLCTVSDRSEREKLVDRTRWLGPGTVRKLLREMPAGPHLGAPEPRRARKTGPAKAPPYPVRAGGSGKLSVAETSDAPSLSKESETKRRSRRVHRA